MGDNTPFPLRMGRRADQGWGEWAGTYNRCLAPLP
jgi:hypothetical protein